MVRGACAGCFCLVAWVISGCAKPETPNQSSPALSPPGKEKPPVDLGKVDYTMTADDYFKEADGAGAQPSHHGKVIEISGPFAFCAIDELYGNFAFALSQPKEALVPKYGSITFGKDQNTRNELRRLTAGQQVKIRGVGTSTRGELADAQIINAGPTTAKASTIGEVLKAVEDPEFKAITPSAEVLLRVKIIERDPNMSAFTWVVSGAESPTGPRLLLQESPSRLFRQEFDSLKAGEVVTILGAPTKYAGQPTLEFARLVKDPTLLKLLPEGK